MNILTLREFYFSSLQQPYLLWLSLIPGIWLLLTRAPYSSQRHLRKWAWLLITTSFFDAWLTAENIVLLGFKWPSGVSSILSFFFVTWGDLRILWTSDLVKAIDLNQERFRSIQAFLMSFFACLIAPVLSGVIYRWGFQEKEGGIRWLFLVYEILFFALIFFWNQWKPLRPKRVFYWVLTYYGLWIIADGLLLSSHEQNHLGWLLRIFANVCYYGGVPYEVARSSKMHTA